MSTGLDFYPLNPTPNVQNPQTTNLVPSRQLVVRVNGTFFQGVGVILPAYGIYQNLGAAGQIRQALTHKGWKVVAVDELSGTGVHRSFNVKVDVQTQYDDATVTGNMTNDLSPIMTLTQVAIVTKGPAQYVDPAIAGTPGISNAATNILGGAVTGFFSNLGLTTPIAVAGGLVVALLILKKL
jgi:hypothetical protein